MVKPLSIPVVLDPTMPVGIYELRDGSGNVLQRWDVRRPRGRDPFRSRRQATTSRR